MPSFIDLRSTAQEATTRLHEKSAGWLTNGAGHSATPNDAWSILKQIPKNRVRTMWFRVGILKKPRLTGARLKQQWLINVNYVVVTTHNDVVPEKKSDFPLYWLVKKEPCDGLLTSPHNWVGFHPLYISFTTNIFFIAHQPGPLRGFWKTKELDTAQLHRSTIKCVCSILGDLPAMLAAKRAHWKHRGKCWWAVHLTVNPPKTKSTPTSEGPAPHLCRQGSWWVPPQVCELL